MSVEEALRYAFIHKSIDVCQEGRLWCDWDWLSKYYDVSSSILTQAELAIEHTHEYRINWFKVLREFGLVAE